MIIPIPVARIQKSELRLDRQQWALASCTRIVVDHLGLFSANIQPNEP